MTRTSNNKQTAARVGKHQGRRGSRQSHQPGGKLASKPGDKLASKPSGQPASKSGGIPLSTHPGGNQHASHPSKPSDNQHTSHPSKPSDNQHTSHPSSHSPASVSVLSHEACCAVRERCGACAHVGEPYANQLANKQHQVEQLFAEVAPANALLPIVGMDDPFYYRNKVTSPFAPGRKLASSGVCGKNARGGRGYSDGRSYGKDGRSSKGAARSGRAARNVGQRYEILIGMYAAHSHQLVPTDTCLLENQDAKAVILAVRNLMPRFGMEPYREDTGAGFLRHAVVRVGHTSGEVLVTLVTNAREFPASKAFCRELVRNCPHITTVVQNVNMRQTNVILGEEERTLYGPGFILDKLCGLSFRISSQSFYQVNATQTEVLYKRAVELAQLTGTETLIDAYCGTGTIGLVAAKQGAARVIGVDSVASAIRDARQNAHHNGIKNAEFIVADAGDFVCDHTAKETQVDVLLMDPPRAGSTPEFLEAATALAPERIVYISCNPETQVRDLALLIHRGYEVRTVQPVDMFPHTDHVETVALITRADK